MGTVMAMGIGLVIGVIVTVIALILLDDWHMK